MTGYLATLGPLDDYDLIALFVKRAIVSNLASDPKLDSFIKKGGGVLWNAYYRYVMYGVETVTSVQRRLKFNHGFFTKSRTKNATFKLTIWIHNRALNIKRKCYI